MTAEIDEQPAETCARCGRDVRLLNPGSDTPKCVGCGLPAEQCTCENR